MANLLNGKSAGKDPALCHFRARVVTLVLLHYLPVWQLCGPQVGVGKAELVIWWFGTKVVVACEERTAAEQPAANIPRTRALTANFMTVLLLKSGRDNVLQGPIYLLNWRSVFSD